MTTRRDVLLGLASLPLMPLLSRAGTGTDGGWRRVDGPLELEWPRDHGAHLDTRTEWWYLTGLVADAGGTELGFQLTIFRSGIEPGRPSEGRSTLRAHHALAAHLAIADVRAGRVACAERVRRLGAGLAEVSERDLDARIEGWSIRRSGPGRLAISAADRVHGIGLDLELEAAKPLVLHGVRGYSRKGSDPGNASIYSSWTRLAARGRVRSGGREHDVRGGAWYDHEWGTSQLGEGVVGWDWFSLRLADGRELMLYHLRRADGSPEPFSAGTLVERDGTPRSLAPGDFSIEVRGTWRSPRSGGVYPAAWTLRVPGAGLELDVLPRVKDAELDTRGSTGVVYWEGPVRAEGAIRGEGYVELTGYAGDLAGRF